MDNLISPFLAILLSKFQTKYKELQYFPSICVRYVDIVFIIFHKKMFHTYDLMSLFNNRFSFEMMNKDEVPVLDVLLARSCTNKLKFDIFKKDTSIHRYISNWHNTRQLQDGQFKLSSISNFYVWKRRSIITEIAVSDRYTKKNNISTSQNENRST